MCTPNSMQIAGIKKVLKKPFLVELLCALSDAQNMRELDQIIR